MIYTYTVHNKTYGTLKECAKVLETNYNSVKTRLSRAGGKKMIDELVLPKGTITINKINLN